MLQSKKDKTRYVGLTKKDAQVRLKKHNSNKGRFTRGHQPWELIYQEKIENKNDAALREKFLKLGKGREWLDGKLK